MSVKRTTNELDVILNARNKGHLHKVLKYQGVVLHVDPALWMCSLAVTHKEMVGTFYTTLFEWQHNWKTGKLTSCSFSRITLRVDWCMVNRLITKTSG